MKICLKNWIEHEVYKMRTENCPECGRPMIGNDEVLLCPICGYNTADEDE